MPMDNVTLENTQQSISSRDTKSVASVMVNGKWVNLSDTLEQANVKSDVGTVSKQVAEQQEVVTSAVAQADSAVAYANDAIKKSKVNSQAIDDINSAVSDAKQGANDAMSRALSAWEVATGAKESVTDFDPLLKSAQSDASNAIAQIADTASALSDAKTEFNSGVAVAKNLANTAQTTADSAVAVASDAKSNATVAIQTASGASLTAINAKNDATVAKQTASEAKVQASNAESDFAQLSIRAGKIEASVANNSGAIASVQQTANGLTTTVGNVDNRVKTIEDKTNWTTKTGPLDMNTLTTTQNIYYRDSNLKNADGETGWAYIQVVSMGERVTQTVWHDRSSIQHTRTGAVSGSSYNWDAWNTVATNAQVVQVKQTVDGIATTINDPKTGLNATYQTAAGNATTISNVKSDVYQLQTTANGLTSRVGNLESKTNTQETAINQNKNAISLKADQTAVDKINGTVSQLQSTLTVQAGQIQEKVTSSQVTGMLAGYATQDYTQSLVTQKANDWNLNLTNLKNDVDAIKANGGGVNLLTNTDKDISVTSHTTDSYPAWAHIDTGFSLEHGKTYTFSAEATNSTNNITEASIRVFELSTNTQVGIYAFPADGNRHSVTFTIPNDSHDYHLLLYAGHASIVPGVDVTTTYHHPNLEFGTVAHDWSPAPSDMATVTSVTNLSATVDGIQAQVYNSDGSSRITQLSNLIATKVSSDDFNNLSKTVELQTLDSADINTMKTNGHYFVHNLANNPIGGWVYVDVTGNGNDRIRQDVYQDLGNQHCYRRWYNSSWTAWSQGATESEITQLSDDINLRVKSADLISQINLQAGATLIQSNKLVLDAGTTVITGEAFIPDAAISEINTDKLFFSDTSGNKSFMSTNLGALDPMAPANSLSIRYKTGYEVTTSDRGVFFMMGQDYTRYAVRSKYSDKFSGIWASDTEAYLIEEGQGLHLWAPGKDQSAWALYNSNNVGIRASLATTNAIEVGKADDGYAYNTKMDTSPTATTLYINGWEWVAGYVEAMGHSQHSILSAKTRIEQADSDHMLDLINQTELTTFAYKSELADGTDHRHIGPIIDDINDVAQYKIPSEFVAPTKTARDDGNIVGALIGAVQALTKRIKTLEDKA